MKLIIAYIQPEMLPSVKKELFTTKVYKLSITNAMGCGQQMGFHEVYRGVEEEVTLLKKIRLEIAVNNAFVDQTVQAIIKGAQTGEIGDGKIFIMDMLDCIRIRTSERGSEAIG